MPKVAKAEKKVPKLKGDTVYPTVSVKLHDGVAAPQLSAAEAKEYLGWEEVEDKNRLFIDNLGKKIRCTNNAHNRPFDANVAKTWESEILNGRWRLNGESLIIGKTGELISAQHRLIALVLAAQEWAKEPERWLHWKTEPTLPCLIVRGISEDDEIVNTVDTGKPRGTDDVIYRTPRYFGKYPESQRKVLAKYTADAIRMLARRTGAWLDAFTPGFRRTHSENLDFLDRHVKLVEAVVHIWEENDENKLGTYLRPGYLAAFLYMFGCCQSDPEKYRDEISTARTEQSLDFSEWDRACEFFVCLAGGDKDFAQLRTAFQKLTVSNEDGDITQRGTLEECEALLILAWDCYRNNEPISAGKLALKYQSDEDGKHLIDTYAVGGIDLGNVHIDPEPEPVKAEPVRDAKPGKADAIPTKLKLGERVTVTDPNSKPPVWSGELIDAGNGLAKVKDDESGKVFEVYISQVSPEKNTATKPTTKKPKPKK